jgi:ATP-dependent DNA helicase RecG
MQKGYDLSVEGQFFDKKSLRIITGKTADWSEVAKDSVAFANAKGGRISIGIEDKESLPPLGQIVTDELLTQLQTRIAELTVNVTVVVKRAEASNQAQFIDLHILRANTLSSTTDGRYYERIGDTTKPILAGDVLRLASDRPAYVWELQTSLQVPRSTIDTAKLNDLHQKLLASKQTKAKVKEKSINELLDHYHLAHGDYLTHLGILFIGTKYHRALLATAPIIQCIKYDAHKQKIQKIIFDDHTLNPVEIVEAVWRDVSDFRERYELPGGLYRQHIPAYDEVVVRELLVNALVHRPYTQRGDIFINLYPDHLEIVNPGLLPPGVTPKNILHTSVRRNEALSKLMHDLDFMENEGTGLDRVFEILLSQGRPAPVITETHDRVEVSVQRVINKPDVIDFIAKADASYQLFGRERIVLGLLAQHNALSAKAMADKLELASVTDLKPWLDRLLLWTLVQSKGRTQGVKYFLNPALLRNLQFIGKTTLQRIESPRLRALIIEDLTDNPSSAIGAVHARVGLEINKNHIKKALDELIGQGQIKANGINRGRRYSIAFQ